MRRGHVNRIFGSVGRHEKEEVTESVAAGTTTDGERVEEQENLDKTGGGEDIDNLAIWVSGIPKRHCEAVVLQVGGVGMVGGEWNKVEQTVVAGEKDDVGTDAILDGEMDWEGAQVHRASISQCMTD